MWSQTAQNERKRQLLRALAAISCVGVRIIPAVVLLTAVACGDERPPWVGFELFPPDAGGIELSPQLEASLQAAQAAFFAQLAAGQGAAGAGTAGASADDAGAGASDEHPPPRAAETSGSAGQRADADEPDKPAMPDANPAMNPAPAGEAGAGGGPRRRFPRATADAGAGMNTNTGGARAPTEPPWRPQAPADTGGQAGSDPPTQPAELDAGVSMRGGTDGQAGSGSPQPPAEIDAGVSMTAGTAGNAGSSAPEGPLDAGPPLPDADGGG